MSWWGARSPVLNNPHLPPPQACSVELGSGEEGQAVAYRIIFKMRANKASASVPQMVKEIVFLSQNFLDPLAGTIWLIAFRVVLRRWAQVGEAVVVQGKLECGDFPSQPSTSGYEMGGFCLFSSSKGLGCDTTGSSINGMAAQEDEAVMPQRPSVWPTSTQGVEEGSRTYSSAGHRQQVASELPLSQGKDSVVVQSVSRVRLSGSSVDCSTPGSSVLHYLLKFAQTHVH